jgi:hypothetical protein
MSETQEINNKSDLNRKIKECICLDAEEEFPKTMIFTHGFPERKYKITIEILEIHEFVDEKGVKWKRVNER